MTILVAFADGASRFTFRREPRHCIAEMTHAGRTALVADAPNTKIPSAPFRDEPDFPGPAVHRAERLRLARVHLVEMWAEGRPDLADALYVPTVTDQNPAPDQRPGIPGIIDALVGLRDAVSDLRMDVHAIIASGRYAADHWTITATHDRAPLFGHAPAGARLRLSGMDCIRFDDDNRITDIWHVEDFAAAAGQIATCPGSPPPGATG